MTPRPDYSIPKPTETLGYMLTDWLGRHAVVPEGNLAGKPFVPTIDHTIFLANHYRLRKDAKYGEAGSAFLYRRSAWIAAQKVGKSPGIAGHALIEFVGPCLFAGWATGGETYRCRDHGCPCGWEYEYGKGEPMGRPWPTPRIQLAAVVEDQVENTWGALVPMINDGPLSNVIPRAGEEFIRHPNGNRDSKIEIVTSKADSKLGARICAAFPDETGLYTDSNKMKKFNRTLMRGLGGMNGRMVESSNPYDPTENSWLQDTVELSQDDVYVHYFPPPVKLDFKDPADRRKIFEFNYQFSPWVDLRSIEGYTKELLLTNPGEAERFYGNRIVAGNNAWMPRGAWEERSRPAAVVQPRTRICLGFDGSESNDWTGIRAETLDLHQFTPTYHRGEREAIWNPRDWGGRVPRLEVNAAFEDIVSEYEVVLCYVDPFGWGTELATWAARWGDRVFVEWRTNRTNLMWEELEQFRTDVVQEDSTFTHDGNKTAGIHIRNAVEKALGAQGKYYIEKPTEDQKIDLAMSSVLAHSATVDSIKGGAANRPDSMIYTGSSTAMGSYGRW
ncbi:phage terminase family protein [Brevibacterium sp. 91QC2O2]|uniref:phage terminase family protein n=1 Tax=Brevibacterium sp. 91QC2O2 TaxID=2968458 RepID=UPI00211C1273|nr:phage terminase family protein [Brevibacterium sp. 91QC2O2]MCQ9367961.1 phage terminase family protein [Brevibacterium sp. 91QC2O2]